MTRALCVLGLVTWLLSSTVRADWDCGPVTPSWRAENVRLVVIGRIRSVATVPPLGEPEYVVEFVHAELGVVLGSDFRVRYQDAEDPSSGPRLRVGEHYRFFFLEDAVPEGEALVVRPCLIPEQIQMTGMTRQPAAGCGHCSTGGGGRSRAGISALVLGLIAASRARRRASRVTSRV